jgi:hypothetical protein
MSCVRNRKSRPFRAVAADAPTENSEEPPFESSELDGHNKIGVLPWVDFTSSKEDGNELSGEAVILRKETPAKK